MLKRQTLKNGQYKSKGKVFLLPMLGITLYHVNKEINHLIDVNFTQSGFPQIVLIFDNTVDYEPLKADIYMAMNLSTYIDSEYSNNNEEVCMFFDVPLEFRKDFELFVKGQYSQFSEKFKDILVKTYGAGRYQNKNKDIQDVDESTGLPKVGIYDVIYPLKKTKRFIQEQLNTVVEITEVLSPPDPDEEEFKTIEELELYEGRKNIPNNEQA